MADINNNIISQLELAMLFNLCQYESSSDGWKSTKDIHKTFDKFQDKHSLSNTPEEIPNILQFKSPQQAYTVTLKKLIKRKLVTNKNETHKDDRGRPRKREIYRIVQKNETILKIRELLNLTSIDKETEFHNYYCAYPFFLKTDFFEKNLSNLKKSSITRKQFLDDKKQQIDRYNQLLGEILGVAHLIENIYEVKIDVVKDIREREKNREFQIKTLLVSNDFKNDKKGDSGYKLLRNFRLNLDLNNKEEIIKQEAKKTP